MSLFLDSLHDVAVTISMIRIMTIAMTAVMIMAVVMMASGSIMRLCLARSYSVAASCAGEGGRISAGRKHRVLHYCNGEQEAVGQRWRRSYSVSLSCNWDTSQRLLDYCYCYYCYYYYYFTVN